ncbi:MAG: flavin oxidoreductase/NADH oxidase [Clostridia bacterium]|nr:flavin oxidoreductase/NADH oxidase [Clostridia bacterium]
MQIPKNRESLENLCREAGVSLPWTEDTSVLKSSLKIGDLTAPNRIAYQAMEGCDGTSGGEPDELTVRRYLRFAKGGPGIIWFEATAVMEEGRANPRQLYIRSDNKDAFARLADRIRETSLKENGYAPLIFMQLTHSGRYSKPYGTPAPKIAYHSPVFEATKPIPDDAIVSDEYLDSVSEHLSAAAKLAQQAGFDGVDIKSCHRYLLCELLSGFTRNGRYGGSYENRTKMLVQTVGSAMASTDNGFIVSSRLNIYDGFVWPYGFGSTEGNGIEPCYDEAIRLVGTLRKMGMPLINLTMGNPYFNPHVNRPFAKGGYEPPEHPMYGVYRMLDGIRRVKEAVPDIAIISSGLSFLGSESGRTAAACISDGWFDFAGYGRQTLADPDVAREVLKDGHPDPKKLCMCCSKCTEIMRTPGGTPGCAVRDSVYTEIYQKTVLRK